jgi:hypothetical protein
MMYKETPNLFYPPFFKKQKIKPYPVDPNTMDLDSTFIAELMDSLKAGYDKTKPIILARSEDERLDGYPIDGRCRLYCMQKNLERKVPLPSPFPVAYLDVENADQLRALIAEYENKNRSKGAKYSKAWVEQNLKAIIKDNAEIQGDKIGAFIKSLGFTNDAVISKMVDEYQGRPTKVKKEKQKRPVVGLPQFLRDSWISQNSSILADSDERLDIQISYKECPDCKNLLKITTDLKGTVLKIESAPSIK